jgi:hypothetical protein
MVVSKMGPNHKRTLRGGREWHSVSPLDKAVRQATACGMEDGTVMTIEFISGFELFGHYESWGQGWRVSGRNVTVQKEWLDDAVRAWVHQVTGEWTE